MAFAEPIKLAVKRFDGGLQSRVSGWVGIDHGRQRGTEHARISSLVAERRAYAGVHDPMVSRARDAFDQPLDAQAAQVVGHATRGDGVLGFEHETSGVVV